ncbi:MAG: ribulose-phosphate 3-epimerase [Candidatus Andersenbacteria bacterium]|nr:ribulose-phosphate 3-epimerase [Candidatus Andersenbacteria bacterium]
MIEFLPTVLVQSDEAFQRRVRAVRPLVRHESVPMLSIDVIDGLFVDALPTYPTAAYVADQQLDVPFEVDLMVQNPLPELEAWIQAGAARVQFHAEVVDDLSLALRQAKAFVGNAEVGVVLNPETSLAVVDEIAPDVDAIQLMGVHPGASGQSFLPETVDRVASLKQRHPDILIAVDGGVSPETLPQLVQAGATRFAVGSFFDEAHPADSLSLLVNAIPHD